MKGNEILVMTLPVNSLACRNSACSGERHTVARVNLGLEVTAIPQNSVRQHLW